MAPTRRYNWRFQVEALSGESRMEYHDAPFQGTPEEADRVADRLAEIFIDDTGLEVARVHLERCGEVR